MDMPDRGGARRGVPPYADGLEAVDGSSRQRQVALVVAGLGIGAWGGGFDQGGGDSRRIQRDGQAGTDQAAADDQYAGVVHGGRYVDIHAPMIRAGAARVAALG